MFGPVIEGARVRLEPPRPEHSPVYLRWLADMEVTRYLRERRPPTPRQDRESLEKVWAAVFVPNEASRRALERNGYRQCALFRRDRYVEGRWHDLWVGEILREEWDARQEKTP